MRILPDSHSGSVDRLIENGDTEVLLKISHLQSHKLLISSKLSGDFLFELHVKKVSYFKHEIVDRMLLFLFRTHDERYSRFIPEGLNFDNIFFKIFIPFKYNIDITETHFCQQQDSIFATISFIRKPSDFESPIDSAELHSDDMDVVLNDLPPLIDNMRLPNSSDSNSLSLSNYLTVNLALSPPPPPPTVPGSDEAGYKTGLINSGNSCYQNSILQAFVRIEKWRSFVQDNLKLIEECKDELALLYSVSTFTKKINEGLSQLISADDIKIAIRHHVNTFENNQQQDAPEYFNALIDALNTDLKKLPSNKTGSPMDEDILEEDNSTAEDCQELNKLEKLRKFCLKRWKEFYAGQSTVLTDLFCGQIAQKLVCEECSNDSILIDPFGVLILNLPQAKIDYHVLLFSRDSETCCCTGVKKMLFRFPPDVPVESLIAILAASEKTLPENIRLIQSSVGDDAYPIGLKSNCLLSDTVRDPRLPILAFQCQKSDDIEEFVILQKTFLRHMNSGFGHLVPIVDMNLKNVGKHSLGLPFIVCIKKSLMCFSHFTKVLMSYAVHSTTVEIKLFPNVRLDLDDAYREYKDFPRMVYYKTTRSLESDEFLSPFLLKDFVCNQEIVPAHHVNENKEIVYFDEATLQTFGYYIVLQWINDDMSLNFPKYGMVRHIGNKCFRDTPYDLHYDYNSDLNDCFKIFSKTEDLGHDDGWKCAQCKQVRVAKKSTHLIKTPNILVLQLVRFKFSQTSSTKINDLIDFPIDGFNLSEFVLISPEENDEIFDLHAVVNHDGNCHGGHYTVAIRNWDMMPGEAEWYNYNDHNVTPIGRQDLVTSYAYLLFFKKRQKSHENSSVCNAPSISICD